jgi:hypothetical protein
MISDRRSVPTIQAADHAWKFRSGCLENVARLLQSGILIRGLKTLKKRQEELNEGA